MKTNRIPIVVGVTGHRDLREVDLDPLRHAVRKILTKLRSHHRDSPFVLLSSLAEGADRLAAQVALDCGFELFVPLPFSAPAYLEDFHTTASQREFSDLLARAQSSFELPLVEGVTSENLREPEHRVKQYAVAGEYVLRHCHILLALWDGHDSGKPGGTSQVVQQKLSGYPVSVRPEWTVLNPPDSGAVFHVMTPRESHPQVEGAYHLTEHHTAAHFFRTKKDEHAAEKKGRTIFASLLERTNTFNRDLTNLEPVLEASLVWNKTALEGDTSSSPDLQSLREQFVAADFLATHFQKKRHHSLLLLCILALGSPVCLAAYHSSSPDHPGNGVLCLFGFLAGAAAALLVYVVAKRGGYETRHLDYRALAEGLKILFFWRVAGIHDDVSAQYLRKQRSEVDWIRQAVRAADLLTSLRTKPAEPYAWVKIQWMEHQLHYFEKSSAACAKREEIFAWWTTALVLLGVGLALIMFAVQFFDYCTHQPLSAGLSHDFHDLSVGIVGMLAAAGSGAAYAEKLAFSQQAKQYKQMKTLFSLAVTECQECLDRGEVEPVRALIRRVGQEALRENGDWVLLHRERPMELRIA